MSRPLKVLIVDDQPSNVATVRKLLASEGYEVLTAESGEEALRVIADASPDLVLLDVYDALTTMRPYRSPVSPETALAELEREAERGWRDRDLVSEFCILTREGQLDRSLEALGTEGLAVET